jgi:hypothetical protein
MANLPAEIDQTWKSWISSTLGMSINSVKHSDISICLGVASIKIETQSLKIGIVVNKQRNVKIKVHIGSTI